MPDKLEVLNYDLRGRSAKLLAVPDIQSYCMNPVVSPSGLERIQKAVAKIHFQNRHLSVPKPWMSMSKTVENVVPSHIEWWSIVKN